MNKSKLSLTSPAVKYGLIAGAVYIGSLSFIYLMNDLVMILAKPLPYLLTIAVAIYAGTREKKLFGGYISFPHALLTIFLALLIAELIWSIYMYVVYNYIAPELHIRMKEANVYATQWTLEKMGTSPEEITERMEYASTRNFRIGIRGLLSNYIVFAILGFLISLIAAAIIKKEKKSSEI